MAAEVYFFTAPWCEPCRQMTPIYGEIAGEVSEGALAGVVGVMELVDVDVRSELADECGIDAVPAAAVRIDGRVVLRKVGAMPKLELREAIEAAVEQE